MTRGLDATGARVESAASDGSKEPRTRAGRLAYLDGIRALAILSVLFLHWGYSYMPDGLPHFYGGYIGVDIFLVLSGYIITTILWRRRDESKLSKQYRAFLASRVRRLYPALVGYVAVGLLAVAIFRTPVSLGRAAVNAVLALTQTMSIAAAAGLEQRPFGQTWTLGWEWYFYLLWPLVILFLRRRGTDPLKAAKVAAVAAALLYLVALPQSFHFFYYTGLLRFAQVLVGASLALYFVSGAEFMPRAKALVRTSSCLVSVVIIVGWATFAPADGDGYKIVAPFSALATVLLIAVCKQWPDSRVTTVTSAPPLAFIGRISYSIYLWHLLPIYVLDKDQLGVSVPVLGAASILSLVVLIALSYRYLEKPFTKARASALVSPAQDVRRTS